MSRPCRNVEDIVSEVRRIIETEKALHPEEEAEFFFRGEGKNYETGDNSEIGTHFSCYLYRKNQKDLWKREREIYQEALRCRIVDFEKDRTMAERLARMQHYQLPTRFTDLSDNVLQSAYFATDAGSFTGDKEKNKDFDGWVRVVKIAKHKMKSFTSDIIVSISHLPLVNPERFHLHGPLATSAEDDVGLNVLRYEIMKERSAFGFEHERPKVAMDLRRDIQQVWAFKPLLGNPRIQKQGGIFLAVGCSDGKEPIYPTYSEEDYDNQSAPSYGVKQIGTIRIAASAKRDIEEELRFFGVRGEQVYPDLSDTCQYIRERYKIIPSH